MSTENSSLANRFFYYDPRDAGVSVDLQPARTWPMSKLHAMYMSDSNTLLLVFDDAGFGDHMVVNFDINNNKGKEAIKDIVDAMNSTQKIVVLGNVITGESVMNDFVHVSETSGGSTGTFYVSGTLSVGSALVLNTDTVSSDGDPISNKPVTFLGHDGDEAVTLADNSSLGRTIRIVSLTDNTVTLTPVTTAGAYATIAFTNIGESVTLMWTANGWAVLSRCGGGTANSTSVATMPVLA